MRNIFLGFLLCVPAFAETISVKVVNLQVARSGLAGGAYFVQNGKVQKPDKLDFTRPYCHTSGHHFQLDPKKVYSVIKMESRKLEDSETWSIDLHFNPQSTDPSAMFKIACLAPEPRVAILDDVQEGLAGIYELNVQQMVQAEEPVVANLKYHLVHGKKAFGARWIGPAQLGVINLGLDWEKYDDSVKEGFILETAAQIEFLSPKMPDHCVIKSLKGTINSLASGTSAVAMSLNGESCGQLVAAVSSTPIEILFTDVKHQVGDGRTNRLHLRIVETP